MTSQVYNANLGGLPGADDKCQTLAAGAFLPGTYKAWLSDETTSAATRLAHSNQDYVLVDKTVVAHGWAGLDGHYLLHAINKTEKGGAPAQNNASCGVFASVWTASDWHGAVETGSSCASWTSASASVEGMVGNANETSSWWTDECSHTPCSFSAALYCIEQ